MIQPYVAHFEFIERITAKANFFFFYDEQAEIISNSAIVL